MYVKILKKQFLLLSFIFFKLRKIFEGIVIELILKNISYPKNYIQELIIRTKEEIQNLFFLII